MTTTEAKRVYLQNENNEILLPYSAQALEDGNGNVISETYVKKTDGGFVAKTGDTMSGNLMIARADETPYLKAKRTNATLGDTPSDRINIGGLSTHDSANNTLALVQGYILADGTNGLQLITRKPDNSGWGASFDIATTADGKQSFSKPQIIVAYINGASGYRIWSNGYCEQWGKAKTTSVTYLKKFLNTDYNLQMTYNTGGNKYGYDHPATMTVSGFTVNSDFYSAGGMWKACGFLAADQY